MRFKTLSDFVLKIIDDVQVTASSLNVKSKRPREDDTATEFFDDVSVEELT